MEVAVTKDVLSRVLWHMSQNEPIPAIGFLRRKYRLPLRDAKDLYETIIASHPEGYSAMREAAWEYDEAMAAQDLMGG